MSDMKPLPSQREQNIDLGTKEQLNRYLKGSDKSPLDRLEHDELHNMLVMLVGTPEGDSVQAEVDADFAQRHRFENEVYWDGDEFRLYVESPGEAEYLKPQCREMGYEHLEIFMGSRDDEGPRWVLGAAKAKNPRLRNDDEKKALALVGKLGMTPLAVSSVPGKKVIVDLEVNDSNVERAVHVMDVDRQRGDGKCYIAMKANCRNASDLFQLVIFATPQSEQGLSAGDLKCMLSQRKESLASYKKAYSQKPGM